MKNNPKLWHACKEVIECSACADAGDCKILRDDLFNLPQPGYVGVNYESRRVLLLGQNPGVSPERFRQQDQTYAEALAAVADMPGPESMQRLQCVLEDIIPTWPVQNKYFPLDECGLRLSEIAYLNVVRCRTKGNTAPSSTMVANCTERHFTSWLDLLQPRVVVCIGKWAHDRVGRLLDQRGIPHRYMNRMRSLSSAERGENRKDVVACVRQTLGQERHPMPKQSAATGSGAEPIADDTETWNSEAYFELFKKLGFEDVELRKTLKHSGVPGMPSLYFNRKRDGAVYFTGYKRDKRCFDTDLWAFIPAQQKKDDVPSLITVIPKPGSERQAFESLLDI